MIENSKKRGYQFLTVSETGSSLFKSRKSSWNGSKIKATYHEFDSDSAVKLDDIEVKYGYSKLLTKLIPYSLLWCRLWYGQTREGCGLQYCTVIPYCTVPYCTAPCVTGILDLLLTIISQTSLLLLFMLQRSHVIFWIYSSFWNVFDGCVLIERLILSTVQKISFSSYNLWSAVRNSL